MADRYVRRDAEAYRDALLKLAPLGPAWPRALDSLFARVLWGIAEVYAAFAVRVEALLVGEADPRSTSEMLEDWERAYGSPGRCLVRADGEDARRLDLVRVITDRIGQRPQDFIELAARLGHGHITIDEFRPFMAGMSRCGWSSGPRRPLLHQRHRYSWRVRMGPRALSWFRIGADGSRCGRDAMLSIDRIREIECEFRRRKPEHTNVIFHYEAA